MNERAKPDADVVAGAFFPSSLTVAQSKDTAKPGRLRRPHLGIEHETKNLAAVHSLLTFGNSNT